MLTPNYLWYVSDRIVEIYEELNTFAIKDICRRLVSADWQMTETARYQLLNLMQSGVILQDIQEKIAEITHKSEKEVAELFKQSAIKSMKYSDALYSKVGYNVLPFTSSEKMMNILTATYLQTNGTLENFTQTIAKATNTEFYKQLDKIYMQIISGQSDYVSAISRAVDQVAKQGIYIDYPSGAVISVEAGVRRATVTGINQACCRLEMERMNEFETDLVVTSQHFGARPSHAEWQGKVFSLSKNSPYPNFYAETGYGTGDGLGGWNCRHSFSPFFEGLSKIPQQYDITKNNEIYEKQQKQRRLERNIRARKREIQGLNSSIENTNDSKVKSELQKKLDIAKNKLKVQNQQYKQYCEDNHFKTQNERLRIAKTSVGYTSKNYQNGLTSAQNSGNMNNKDIPLNLKETIQNLKDNINIKISSRTIKDYHFGDGTSNKSNNYIRNATVYNYSNNISFVYPKPYNSEMQPINLERAVKIFNDVPQSLLKFVEKIEFVDYRNPQDTYWEKTYHIKGFVSFATGGNKEICFWGTGTKTDDTTILETYIHEIGHNFDNEIKMSSSSEWQQAINKDFALNGKKSPTSYGTKSNAEDFSESLAYYFVHAEDFEEQFPNRAEIIRRILNE